MVGLQSGEGRTMINSVVWAQYKDRQTDRQTDKQPRRHSKCRAKRSMRWVAKTVKMRKVETKENNTLRYIKQQEQIETRPVNVALCEQNFARLTAGLWLLLQILDLCRREGHFQCPRRAIAVVSHHLMAL